MDIENKIIELEQKIISNKEEIINTINNLHSCEEKVNNNKNKIEDNTEKIRANSLIIDILKDYKKEVKILEKVLGIFAIIILALLSIIFFK